MAAARAASLLILALAAIAAAAPAAAQRIVTSPRPDSVDVTVYRDTGRGASEAFDLDWLEGYALVSETRRIRLPAGESELRFEGVAAGLVPQSVIVTGLPEDVVERNRDALLLSPATLVDRSVGRRVTVRRTSFATGRVREQDAVIRTGADGAVVLQTRDGFEALRCTGLPETLTYDHVPRDLSARPTLSVRTRSRREVTATVTLSYVASGFDWQANYVATLSPDGERADLFAWLTLASNDETSFPNADVYAVAGYLNRDDVEPQPAEGPPLELRCWPHSTTSDIPLEQFTRTPLSPPLPPPPPPPPPAGEALIVTGTRIPVPNLESSSPVAVLTAEEVRLGDVKLYRIPEPVTIASNAQKQVALLQRSGVHVSIVHRLRINQWQGERLEAVQRWLIAHNREAEGLGVALPGGPLLVFMEHDGRPMLVGESSIDDRAVGDDVEIPLGASSGVVARLKIPNWRAGERDFELVVTNDATTPVRFEAELDGYDDLTSETPLDRRDGRPLWAVTVAANGRAELRYRVRSSR